MEQSDLVLAQIAPAYHMQMVARGRRLTVEQGETLSTTALTALAERLFDPAALQRLLQNVKDLERQILQELVQCGGRANSRELALYFSYSGLITGTGEPHPVFSLPVQYPNPHPHGAFEQAVRHLLSQGLLFWGRQTTFSERDYASGAHDGVLIVPHAVQQLVRKTIERARPSEPRNTLSEGALKLQRSLYLYWSLVAGQREGLPLLASGLLTRSSLRQVLDLFGEKGVPEQPRQENDLPYLFFLRLLLQNLGLLQIQGNQLRAKSATAFFSLPFQERARRCCRLYLETAFWNEIPSIADVNVRPGPIPLEPAHDEIVVSRRMVVERLQQDYPTEWQEEAVFIAHSKLYIPYLLFPRQYGARTERYSSSSNPYGWDFRLRRGWLTHREGWHQVEGGFIRSMLEGPLNWLGIVEVRSTEGSSKAFRLAPGASALFGTEEIAEDLTWGKLIVQPNFEMIALAPVSEGLLLSLDRFAERISLEQAAQYRLTRASITKAIQRGMLARQILAILEQASVSSLPQNVSYSITEWERQARRIEMWRTATLLEVADVALLDRLCEDEQTRELFLRRLAPGLVEVAPQRLTEVLQLFWQQDYLPAVTTAPEHQQGGQSITHEQQWQLHPNGSLQPLYEISDLYLVEEAAHFTERDPVSGHQKITPESLHRALERGYTLEAIVQFFQQYSSDGIPAELLIRLKLWGGGYGSARTIQVERTPLLRLPEMLLRDLQADPAISQLLGEEIEVGSRLVRVAEADLERLLETLRQRGFTV